MGSGLFGRRRGRRSRARLLAASVCLLLASTTTAAGDARADTITTADALALAQAIADPSVVAGASFLAKPALGTPDAVMTTALAGFPTRGSSYALLTTGDANLAGTPNTSSGSGVDVRSPNVRGDSDFDVTILKVDLKVPPNVNCMLGIDFRFLSEEYPEWVGSAYNDAFIAELDKSTWTTSGSTISAPDNFAFDAAGNPITINSIGTTTMTPDQAAGTTYDGATPLLTAATPITPGAHSLYLSVFDAGDHNLDSAVMLNNLSFGHVNDVATECKPGAKPATRQPVLVVHGVDETATNTILGSLKAKVEGAVPAVDWTQFVYYQDKSSGCVPGADGSVPPVLPASTGGLPIDASQNDPMRCDSEGDLGQNAVRLDQRIKELYAQSGGKKVILVGYSMGAETIRSFLAYSGVVADGVAAGMVDSVVTTHGVQQGSWLASAAPHVPSAIGNWLHDHAPIPNTNRPAVRQFDPTGPYLGWVLSNSGGLPDIPYYNTWGDEHLTITSCWLPFEFACNTTDAGSWGDVVLMPGQDSPTARPSDGGQRFLPTGYTNHSWQWTERADVGWDPQFDPFQLVAIQQLVAQPQFHSNVTDQQAQIPVKDCKDGSTVSVDEELSRVIVARLNGSTYACDPSVKP